MSAVLSFLDCGCAILDSGRRVWCPTCESGGPRPTYAPLPAAAPQAHPASVATVEAAMQSAAVLVLLQARYLAHYNLYVPDAPGSDGGQGQFFRELERLLAAVRRVGPLAASDSFTPLERLTAP